MDPDPIGGASRAARRTRRIGRDQACQCCGESDPTVLILEDHHVGGEANDRDLIVRLCLNCHRRQTAQLRDLGVAMSPPATVLDRTAAVLTGMGALLLALGHSLIALAALIMNFMAGLDDGWPAWRTMPWAAP